jgi:phage gp45-like
MSFQLCLLLFGFYLLLYVLLHATLISCKVVQVIDTTRLIFDTQVKNFDTIVSRNGRMRSAGGGGQSKT